MGTEAQAGIDCHTWKRLIDKEKNVIHISTYRIKVDQEEILAELLRIFLSIN